MTERLDTIFNALSDPTRRAILARVADGEAQVGDIAARFDISPPAISRHLKVLEEAGLITRRIDAQRRLISLNPDALRTASNWVDQYRRFWEGSLDRLAARLADERDAADTQSKKEPRDDRTGKSRRKPRR